MVKMIQKYYALVSLKQTISIIFMAALLSVGMPSFAKSGGGDHSPAVTVASLAKRDPAYLTISPP